MRQQIFEEALRHVLALAKNREQDGAELPSAILARIERIAKEALRRD